MSVLTKVLVVVLVFASVVLSAFVIAAFARMEDWRASAADWQATAAAAQAKERAMTADSALQLAAAQDRHQRNAARISELESQKAALDRETARLERERAEVQNKLTVEQGTVAALSNQATVLLADLNREREFGGKLAKRNSELEKQNVDLNDRVKELTTNVAMAQSQVRALQQQLAAVTNAPAGSTAAIATDVALLASVEPNMPSIAIGTGDAATAPIRGEVKSVQGERAAITVGSADGVAPGMKFLIYRAAPEGGHAKYLATLRIARTDVNESVGVIEQVEGEVRPGDTARDLASFAMR